MYDNTKDEALVDEEKTTETPAPSGQEQAGVEVASTGAEASPYVTREEYERLLHKTTQQDELIKRVQSQSSKGLEGIRQQINTLTTQAVNGVTMATGKAPTPEEVTIIQQKARDQVLMGVSDEAQPQAGQSPAGQTSQATTMDYQNDPYFLAANQIASTVDGGLSDKDPEFKLVDYNAATPDEWLATVTKAVKAKEQRIASQKQRSSETVTMVSSTGGKPTTGGYDPTEDPSEILSRAHKQQKRK